jgi:hypothetical protein
MSTEYGAGLRLHIMESNPASTHHRADLEAVCWFVSLGLSLTGLVCVLGYGDAIGQIMGSSG